MHLKKTEGCKKKEINMLFFNKTYYLVLSFDKVS
jgi:hypothetical protein